jgi:hypothetical protein
MNNTIVVIPILSLLSFLVIISSTDYIFAQYSGGEQVGSSSLEEQLKLAQEKLKIAGQEGAYGSDYSIPSGSQTENIFNCDFPLDRTHGIETTSSRSNLTFNDSINIVSFNQPDDWNGFTISGKIPSLNWDFNALVSINNYASASFIVVSLPQIPTNFTIPKEQFESILSSSLFSQFFTIKDSSDITFGNKYYGYFYDVSINEEQLDKISLFLPYIQKPLESIVIITEVSDNGYLIMLSTDFYPKDSFKDNSSSTSQLDIYESQFCQMLDSIRFEPLNNN